MLCHRSTMTRAQRGLPLSLKNCKSHCRSARTWCRRRRLFATDRFHFNVLCLRALEANKGEQNCIDRRHKRFRERAPLRGPLVDIQGRGVLQKLCALTTADMTRTKIKVGLAHGGKR
jgi:hypothetical protein